MVQHPMRAKAYCAYISIRDLGAGMHEHMSLSGGQYEAKSPVVSPQASLALIYRPTEGMKVCFDLAQPKHRPPNLWCGSMIHYHSATGLHFPTYSPYLLKHLFHWYFE
ncbi:hypothetical protein TNCV_940541 [Trichonephila clavipes]|nr:hypothetical protein TNCV_940541 [Trichonephila clavipes]